MNKRLSDLIVRLALIGAAVALSIVAGAPGEAVFALLGAVAPSPKLGGQRGPDNPGA